MSVEGGEIKSITITTKCTLWNATVKAYLGSKICFYLRKVRRSLAPSASVCAKLSVCWVLLGNSDWTQVESDSLVLSNGKKHLH